MEEVDLMPPIDWVENKTSIIKIIGVGGGGGNAVNYMFRQGIHNVDFVVCNTDEQDLKKSPVQVKVQIGKLGAGGIPEVGRQAAMDHLDKIRELLEDGTKMVFVTAGMGGGTGTGATPVIARIAKELGILTVAIVTIPFRHEGEKRFKQAIEGVNELKNHVDALLVINNDRLIEIYGELTLTDAFEKADNVLTMAAKGIAELITRTGKINLDFADVSTVMKGGGITVIGSATASGAERARQAVEAALTSPLLNDNDITGARRILLNITTGGGEYDLKTSELGEITDFVTRVAKNASMIWGTGNDEVLGDAVQVTVVATDFSANCIHPTYSDTKKQTTPIKISLGDGGEPAGDTFSAEGNGSKSGGFIIRERPAVTPVKPETTWYKPSVSTFADTETDVDVLDEEEPQTQEVPVIVNKKLSIDEIEGVPAYKRRNVKLGNNVPATEKEVSKYTLSSDKENTVRLRDNNAYLYNRAD